MKQFRKFSIITGALFLMVLGSIKVSAQEWSSAQKEVWKNVEAYWALYSQGDLEGYMAYFHADYRGWTNEAASPVNKASIRKSTEYGFKNSKNLLYDLMPAAIQIYGNVAFVHYYYASIDKGTDSKANSTSGTWTDILLKQGDKWLIVGDHGGQTSKD